MSIRVEQLTKRFGDHSAVESISFEAQAGKVTGFLGPNGAGKSTTLRMILGLVRPTAGRSTVLGRPYRALDQPARSVGALLDTEQFHPARSGIDHLRVMAAATGIERRRIGEVLALAELGPASERKVGAYSLGMRQRLGIAAALLGAPEVLVLDEPANGLDPAGMLWLRGFLRSQAAEGKTVLVSSHLLGEIAQMADDVVVIDRGRLVTQASVDELLHRAGTGARVKTPQPERLRDVLATAGIDSTLSAHDELSVEAPPDVVGRVALDAGVPITGLSEEQHSLEDVFLELTKHT